MAWGYQHIKWGVCGNFKFEIVTLTDIKTTRSLIKPRTMSQVNFVASTNETDNADVLLAKTLAWNGTCDSKVANQIVSSAQVFDPLLTGTYAANITDTVHPTNNPTLIGYVSYKDADELYISSGYAVSQASGADFGKKPFDLCPDGNEDYTIYSERIIEVLAVSANDDGTLLIIGR